MQVLSTIYEVAFNKKKGRHLPSSSSSSSSCSASKAGKRGRGAMEEGGEVMGGSVAVVDLDETRGGGGEKEAMVYGSSEGIRGDDSTAALHGALLQEVLGVNIAHSVSSSSSSSSTTSGGNGSSEWASSLSSSLVSSQAPSGTGTPFLPLSAAALRGFASPFWRVFDEGLVPSGMMSEISSLTDAQEYGRNTNALYAQRRGRGGIRKEEHDELEQHEFVQDRSESSSEESCEWMAEDDEESEEMAEEHAETDGEKVSSSSSSKSKQDDEKSWNSNRGRSTLTESDWQAVQSDAHKWLGGNRPL
jgi:hypothetical protein